MAGWRMATALAAAVVLSASTRAAEAGRGGVYSVIELGFRGPPRAAGDVDLRARFRHESGSPEYVVPGFHDGGGAFKVRFCPTRPGRWDLVEVKSGAGELDGPRQGDHVTATPSRHRGFLRRAADNPYCFRYDDGTPCFLWGQTYYRLLDGARAGDRWKAAVDGTRAAGMNKVRFYVYPRIATAGGPDPAAAPADAPTDPAYWQALDEVVRYLGERGVIADLILMSKNYRFGDDDRDRRYVREVVARYAAFPNVAFCLSNEWNYTPKPRPYWNGLGTLIAAEDPWAVEGGRPRLLSVHQQTRWDFQFFGQPWVAHAIVQVGVRNGQAARADEFKEAEANSGGRIREGDRWGNRSVLVNWGHRIPVVNDEYGYIGEPEDKSEPKQGDKFVRLTREKHRQAMWGIAAAGGYGSAGDKSDHPGGRPYSVATYWQDVPEYGDVKRLVDFFTTRGVEYWKMAAHNELVKAGERVYVLAEPGRQYVAYAAVGGPVTLDLAPGSYVARRYDQRTGKEADLPPVRGGGSTRFDLPAGEDWVVSVRATARD